MEKKEKDQFSIAHQPIHCMHYHTFHVTWKSHNHWVTTVSGFNIVKQTQKRRYISRIVAQYSLPRLLGKGQKRLNKEFLEGFIYSRAVILVQHICWHWLGGTQVTLARCCIVSFNHFDQWWECLHRSGCSCCHHTDWCCHRLTDNVVVKVKLLCRCLCLRKCWKMLNSLTKTAMVYVCLDVSIRCALQNENINDLFWVT